MGILPGAGSAARRFIKTKGETVTLSSESQTVDTSSDWDDTTYTTTTATVTALVTRTRQRGELVSDETGTEVDADFIVWLDGDVESEESITVRDSSGDDPPTTVTIRSVEYEVVWVDRSIDNIVRLEVAR